MNESRKETFEGHNHGLPQSFPQKVTSASQEENSEIKEYQQQIDNHHHYYKLA